MSQIIIYQSEDGRDVLAHAGQVGDGTSSALGILHQHLRGSE